MASQILAVGDTATDSPDVVVTSDGLTVALKGAAGPHVDSSASVSILLKDDAGEYFQIDVLDRFQPALFISAPGTYRFRRTDGNCGVFSA